jgi:hypothetical protein
MFILPCKEMSWVKHIAHIGVYKNWLENLKETGHFENPNIDGWIILKWILKKKNGKVWTEFMWLKIRTGGMRRSKSQKRSCELTVWGKLLIYEYSTHHSLNAWTVFLDGRQCSECHCYAMSQHPHILVQWRSLVYFTPPYFKMLPHDHYLCGSLIDNTHKKNTYKEDDWKKLSGVPYQQYLDKKLKQFLMCSPGGTHIW